MAIDGTEVRVAGAGHVYVAPAGTALPTALAALPADWIDLGYCTEDGVAFSFGRDTSDLNAWQGTKVRVLTTGEPKSVSFTLMQSNADTIKVAMGGGSITTTTGVSTYTPPAAGVNTERAMVIEFTDGDIDYRYCIPRTQLQGTVEFSLTRTGAVQYPLEFGVLDATPVYTIVTDDPALATA